ncbi:MAG: AI-2E family transporter, partial [Thermomicrobiales bacterium]
MKRGPLAGREGNGTMQTGGSEPGPADRRRGEPLTAGRVALFTITILAVLLGAVILVKVQQIVILFLIGILLASAIEPVVNRLHARGLGRGQSVLVVYVLLFIAVGALVAVLVPTVINQVARFFTSAPNLIDDLRHSVQTSQSVFIRDNGPYLIDEIERRVTQADIPTERALTLATYLPGVFGYFIQGIITIVTTLMVGFYWITEKAIIKRVFLSFFGVEERRARVHMIWDDIETKLGGWIRGQLILMAIIGIVASIGYTLLGLKFSLLLGVLAGLFEIIPFFGPWISGVPAVLIALTQSWRLAVAVVVFMVAIQMIEGNVLVPRIMKDSVGLSPLLVVLAVLVGGTLLGPVGSIIAIPIAAAIQVLISDLVRSHQEALAAEGQQQAAQVFRWRGSGLPRRLQGVQPGPAVVSPVVELRPPETLAESAGDAGANGAAHHPAGARPLAH